MLSPNDLQNHIMRIIFEDAIVQESVDDGTQESIDALFDAIEACARRLRNTAQILRG